ncbi:A/G-specific adenine glycosylase [Cohnella nanjingensis]|uniref:Adenine DNA glycosylase n=1 Tax=Cohnella nanjingensis TaxID=1387779 RepID=A0A7X0RT82_9BACL|nr:A/G-specific adenine glycosylase [Cohnella nanjingensis]MBB6673278.1 A/G-specific adenine glycosylase [Cohnella nanjingensis]
MNERTLKAAFSEGLLGWYKVAKRDLPWRRSRDPYHIWISEIMLQQTRVDTVIPYFNRFVERFPTVADLAAAPEEDVLKAWEGLGYYSRARNLQAAAREVTERYGGRVPDDKAAVSGLKGVGPYTSGAIMSIAFNRPEPAVDGNVMRVLSRYFCIDEDIARPATRIGMEGLARKLIPEGEAADFNQALMELGAMICTPKSPSCLVCPVMEHCQGRQAGREEELPIKTKAKPPKPQYRLAALTLDASGRVLVRQRPEQGLLARLWELPHAEIPDAEQWRSAEAAPALFEAAMAAEGLAIRAERHIADAEHIFTHLHWYVRVWTAELTDGGEAAGTGSGSLPEGYRWIGPAEFEQLAWPNLFRKLLAQHFSGALEAAAGAERRI